MNRASSPHSECWQRFADRLQTGTEGMILDVVRISPNPLEPIWVMVSKGAELAHVIGAVMQIVYPF
jgi:hypothetical protein